MLNMPHCFCFWVFVFVFLNEVFWSLATRNGIQHIWELNFTCNWCEWYWRIAGMKQCNCRVWSWCMVYCDTSRPTTLSHCCRHWWHLSTVGVSRVALPSMTSSCGSMTTSTALLGLCHFSDLIITNSVIQLQLSQVLQLILKIHIELQMSQEIMPTLLYWMSSPFNSGDIFENIY